MGQGSDSCGGYEVDYDEYEDGLADGYWTCRDGNQVKVHNMTLKHLKGARHAAANAARRATFSNDQEKWENWVEIFDEEIARRSHQTPKALPLKPKQVARGKMATMICYCGKEYEAREADLKRGWGLTCCKRHAAIRREYNKPAARRKNNG